KHCPFAQGRRPGPTLASCRYFHAGPPPPRGRKRIFLPDPPENPLNPGDSMATRIMLVEDDQSLAMGLEFNLRSEGYAVDVFSDAESAQEALSREPVYDLILLDRMLPGKEGLTDRKST